MTQDLGECRGACLIDRESDAPVTGVATDAIKIVFRVDITDTTGNAPAILCKVVGAAGPGKPGFTAVVPGASSQYRCRRFFIGFEKARRDDLQPGANCRARLRDR
jgi:hypothetical protein